MVWYALTFQAIDNESVCHDMKMHCIVQQNQKQNASYKGSTQDLAESNAKIFGHTHPSSIVHSFASVPFMQNYFTTTS